MMLCNYIPMIKVIAIVMIILSEYTIAHKIISLSILIYLIPPLLCSLILKFSQFTTVKHSIDSKQYHIWWLTFNLQVFYTRFSFFEEFLRMIPMLYSFWLRLWGAKIGKFTYWSPKTMISDRSFLEVGDNVVIGAGARIIPHYMKKDDTGNTSTDLYLAPVKIEDGVILGGYSVLGPGTIIKKNVSTRAFHLAMPFSKIESDTASEEI